MLLHYNQGHKSIDKSFQDLSLPNFVVLTGKNGSGKTHLLSGIKEGKFTIDDINTQEILYLSYLDFAQNFQTRTNRTEQINAWQKFNAPGDIISQLKQQISSMSSYGEIIENSAILANKPIFSLAIHDIQTPDNSLKQQVFNTIRNAKIHVITNINKEQYNGDSVAHSIVDSVLKQTKILPSNIKEIDFYSAYQRTVFGNSKILSDLSTVFFEYYKNIDRNERNERKGKTHLSNEDFIKKFGPAPWELIRNIFVGFGLHFDINDPAKEDTDPLDGSFGIAFYNMDRNGKVVDFADLSSGEQILITLVNSIYTASSRGGLPRLILLDEVDSPLNPSIIGKFITYILDNFVANGINVFLATHSPSTVAFAPEESIYLVNTKNVEPLTFTNSSDAINVLSEGFITLSDVLNFEKIPQSKIIISEGKNYEYLLRAKEIYAPEDQDLTILDFNIGGTSQLRTLFEFMRNFNKSKTFIFVFDCDYRHMEIRDANGGLVKEATTGVQTYKQRNLEPIKSSANSNNKFFILSENSDSSSSRGIENLFTAKVSNGYTGVFDDKSPKNKRGFEKYILARNENSDFINFKPMFDFINKENQNTNF